MQTFKISDIFSFRAPYSSCVLTLGNFDGVHLAHQKILRKMVELAREENIASVVVTYFPSLKNLIRQEQNTLEQEQFLFTFEEKKKEIAKYGVDYLILVSTSKDLLRVSAFSFLHAFLRERLHMKHLVIGYDHQFGFRGRGNYQYLMAASRRYLFGFVRIKCSFINKCKISSTQIRNSLKDGDLQTVSTLLNSYFFASGTIILGEQIGQKLNFPTINLQVLRGKILPSPGVYLTYIKIEDMKEEQYGVTNIGFCPTMKTSQKEHSIEMFVLDFHKETYGLHARIHFIKRIRDEKLFESSEKLKNQIYKDVQEAKIFFKKPLKFTI